MNFDPIARFYCGLERAAFGNALQTTRIAFLPEVRGARRALALGDGDGRFLQAFARAAPEAEMDALDASRRMNALGRARAGCGVRFRCADARDFAFEPRGYDLVTTHFFLDCFTDAELARLVPRITAATVPEARWLVSEFNIPKAGILALRAKAWIGLLYLAFGWTTGLQVRRLPDYRAALRAAGYELEREKSACGGLLVSQLWRRSP